MMRQSPPLLRIQHLAVRYGATVALERFTLVQEPRSIVALLGPNGAGKSSLLKAIIGLVPAAGGSIQFAYQHITEAPPEARAALGIAYVPEGRRVFPGLTARENLEVAAVAPPAERKRRFDRVLVLFPQLEPHLGRRAWQLSGGQQQMLAIGRALMTAPKLLLLDEPSLGLAPVLVEQLFARIASLPLDGTGVLLAEQNTAAALSVAQRALVLREGHVVANDAAAALARRPELTETILGPLEGHGPPL
jgi:branched-chain amino acid transport system ATP-binding protein